jgi:hypothetical protein
MRTERAELGTGYLAAQIANTRANFSRSRASGTEERAEEKRLEMNCQNRERPYLDTNALTMMPMII